MAPPRSLGAWSMELMASCIFEYYAVIITNPAVKLVCFKGLELLQSIRAS